MNNPEFIFYVWRDLWITLTILIFFVTREALVSILTPYLHGVVWWPLYPLLRGHRRSQGKTKCAIVISWSTRAFWHPICVCSSEWPPWPLPREPPFRIHPLGPSSNSVWLLTSNYYVPSLKSIGQRVRELWWNQTDSQTARRTLQSHKEFHS